MHRFTGAIFDLDGVLVDTARYHYLAWRRLARELGFDLTPEQNERLKGVSRMESLEIVLGIGGVITDPASKEQLAALKNEWYKEYLSGIGPDSILPGAIDFVAAIRGTGVKTAIASASRNAMTVVGKLDIGRHFDAVVDGSRITRPKPDPEIFLLAAGELGLPACQCAVFEDAGAGVRAAKAAGMYAVGIGRAECLECADLVRPGLDSVDPYPLFGKAGATA